MSIAETTKKRDIIRMLGTIVGSVAVMSVYGVGFTALVIADMIKRRATVYYGEAAEFEPSVYGPGSGLENVTCAPQWPPSAEKFYTDAKALSFAVQRNPFYHYMFCVLCSGFLCWQGFFQPTGRLARITAGLVGCITLLAGLYFGNVYTTYETIWANDGNLESQKANDMWNTLYITFIPLLVALTACQVCASPAKRKGKLMCRYVLFCIVEFVLERLYEGEYPVLNYADFFDESTTLFEKLLIRVVMHTVVTKMRIENVWQFTRVAVKDHGLPQNCGSIYVAYYMALMSFYGRLMSGSATSVSDCLMYEVAATLSELLVSLDLLKGITPGAAVWAKVRCLMCRKAAPKAPSAVVPVAGATDEAGEGSDSEAVEEAARHKFCADLLITLSLTEAYSLIVVGAYIWLVNANPTGSPGAGAIGSGVMLLNIAIQLVGELGVTDFLVAYMSSHSKSSKINLVREFAESSTPIYLTTLAVISLTPGFLLGYASSNMCFTSRLENEDDWALTSCPMEYFEPISDMLRVDPKYL